MTEKDRLTIVNEYNNNLTPMIELANTYRVTRQRIWQVLKDSGVDTSKRKLTVTCSYCSKQIRRTKARVRRTQHQFCGLECYYAWLDSTKINKEYWRHGMRQAREAVLDYYPLKAGQVVHHIDGNHKNNTLKNLAVFACNGDHVRYHRGFDVKPIWVGKEALHNDHFTE